MKGYEVSAFGPELSTPDTDDLADARDDLGPNADPDTIQWVAEQRASIRSSEERKG